MRSIYVIFIVLLSTNANAQMRESHLKTLLSICETAQSNNDPGTIKNIATQIKNEPLHSDKVLAFKMKKCLSAAFGVEIVTCAPSSLQLCAESLGLNLWR